MEKYEGIPQISILSIDNTRLAGTKWKKAIKN